MGSIICIGDNVADKFVDRGIMYPGGNALNVSVHAARLGMKSAYLGIYGTDDVAALNRAVLAELGVDDSHSRQVPGENGFACVQVQQGDRVFLGSNKGGVAKTTPWRFSSEDIDYIKGFDSIHTSVNSYIDDELALLAGTGLPIAYDYSVKWTDALLEKTAKNCRIGFFSCGHLGEGETRAVLAHALGCGMTLAVATRGAHGALCCWGDQCLTQPAIPVQVVDTMGAGDAFIAGFLCRLTDLGAIGAAPSADNLAQALRAGAEFAGVVCQQEGAFGHGVPLTGPVLGV